MILLNLTVEREYWAQTYFSALSNKNLFAQRYHVVNNFNLFKYATECIFEF